MKRRFIASALCIGLLGGCASTQTATEQEVFQQYPLVSKAHNLLNTAKNANLALFSPAQLQAAQNAYNNALKYAKSGKPEAKTAATEVIKRIEAAEKQAQKANYVFEEVFDARKRATAVNASELAPNAFNRAEEKLTKMLSQLELGEEDKATRDITALKNEYLAVELAALKSNMLSVAQQSLKQAKQADLDDIAPRTIAQAENEYQLAQNILEANRTDTDKANVHSNRVIWLVKRAEGIAEINRFFKNSDFDKEQQILWYQTQLSDAVSPLISNVPFNQNNKEVIAAVRQDLTRFADDNKTLNSSLASLKDNQTQLAKEKEEALLAAQLRIEKEQQAKREHTERFNAVQSLFSEDEATVYRQRDNVLIRAQGFSFKPGSSEIESNNFALLNKIIAAIGRFPKSTIIVSGHTDATGSAEINLKLSKDRAKTVANFLTQVGQIDQERVEWNGYGKQKPVASNETQAGRAQNRRVEILIVN